MSGANNGPSGLFTIWPHVGLVRIGPLIILFMFYPPRCPVVDDRPFCYSVGFYRGKDRVVLAWFVEERDALDYLRRVRTSWKHLCFDMLNSLF